MNLATSSKPLNANSNSTTECGNCGSKSQDCFFLHHVRLRGIYRRLCTSCVLLLHPSSFCPSCFTFYDSTPPPPSKRLSCAKCSSFTHSHCVFPSPPPSSFLCPPCSKPNFTFFRIDPDVKIIDKNMAAVLLCAARIASASMAKAVTVARAESERRAREAALCRKRAREALEHVTLLANNNNNDNDKEKLLLKRKLETLTPTTAAAAATATTPINTNGNVNDNFGHANSNSNARVKEEGINSFVPN